MSEAKKLKYFVVIVFSILMALLMYSEAFMLKAIAESTISPAGFTVVAIIALSWQEFLFAYATILFIKGKP